MMASSLRVLLVGNHAPDAQHSMRRFAALLQRGLQARDVPVRVVEPAARLGKLGRSTTAGVGKWLAYVDKYAAFPLTLRRVVRSWVPTVVHVCDHSNAVYVPAARAGGRGRTPVLVTCHDLGAVRGALGETEATRCAASPTGRILQRWIATSLGRADRIACVTAATRADVARLIRAPGTEAPPPATVIPLSLPVPYRPVLAVEADARLRAAGFDPDPARPFLLHVGSGLPRKNRDGVLRIFGLMASRWPAGRLVFAGERLLDGERALAGQLGVSGRVVHLGDVTDAVLEALYSRALALVFPSHFEGFGWPVIEAQACGCPVVCGNTPALAEVAGAGAFVRPPAEEDAFAEHLLALAAEPTLRATAVERGLKNAARFGTERMVEDYLALYRRMSDGENGPEHGG